MSDNYKFDLVCTPLKPSLEIAFQNAAGGKAVGWKEEVVGENGRAGEM